MSTVATFFALMFGVPALLLACTFVARDMDRRGRDGRVYGALTLVLPPVGLALWVVHRGRHPVVECAGR